MELSIKKHDEPLPQSLDEVMAYLKRVIVLPKVQQVLITPNSISVVREVREGEAVVPPEIRTEEAVNVSDLIQRIKLTPFTFDEEQHPYMILEEATRQLTEMNLFVTHIMAPEGGWLSAWMGLEYQPAEGSRVLGMKVVYSNSDLLDGKLLLLGSPVSAGLLVDTTHGIVIDL